jgi:hypothetical protein
VAANTAETISMTTNEKILKECHDLYVAEEKGLIALGHEVGTSLLSPRKKITVLLIGNHSAGKSSFINWYIEEHVQKTAVAIETQGFTIVTSGKKRESLMGNATLHLFPQYKELGEKEGVIDYLSTEITASKQKRFPFVTFIDTPGLVDGDMKYPFDVDQSLILLGELADLVLVFFDPLGQALCKRTLDIVERLNNSHPDRIKFYLSKADTAGSQGDRQKVLVQITQELCKRSGLNKVGFEMPTIFIPTLTESERTHCVNRIEEVTNEIEKGINRNIQSTLNALEKDAQMILSKFRQKLADDKCVSKSNRQSRCRAFILYICALLFPAVYGALAVNNWDVNRKMETIDYYILIAMIIVTLVILIIGYKIHRVKKTLKYNEKLNITEKIAYLNDIVTKRKSLLYEEYLSQSVAVLDMIP